MTGRIVLLFSMVAAAATAQGLTARQVIERIQAQVGVPWQKSTVDTIKSGDPDTKVTGIATTMMATLDVLQRASAEGKNMVITHEPTFYSHLDGVAEFEKEHDAVWAAKEAFIREHHMVVFRFHDHWHAHRPDGVLTGVTRVLGWQKYQSAAEPSLYTIPATTVRDLAAEIEKKFAIRTLRVIGDSKMNVTRVGLLPGAAGFGAHRQWLQRDQVEVLVIGEVPEWETIEYVTDAVTEGRHKALILMGHIPSEQAGMEDCAGWLNGFISEVPVGFVAAKEPFWQVR